MTTPIPIDHVELGLSRLLTQWKDSPKIKGLLESWLNRSNELESLLFEILEERGIFEAEGVQIDIIGALFGLNREGRTDDQFRAAILNQISINNADGTTEVFMQLLRTISGSDFVDFWEHNSGDVHALMGDGFTVFTYPDIEDQVPVGVSLRIYVDDEFDSFQGAELLQEVSDLQTNLNEDIQVTPDGVTLFDLQVQKNIIDTEAGNPSVLPEIIDNVETPYLAELLFSRVQVTTGNIIDDMGNFVIDDLNNNIIWVDYNF